MAELRTAPSLLRKSLADVHLALQDHVLFAPASLYAVLKTQSTEQQSKTNRVGACVYASLHATCRARYCKNLQFPFTLHGQPVNMIFTSVMGHLMELEFSPPYNSWQGCRAAELIDRAPVVKGVPKGGENEKVALNLRNLAQRAQWLVLWLDCDREGENIAFEVIQECRSVKQNLVIKRARFSALIRQDIFRAVNTLVDPNANESAAVDCRQEIDLRIGAAFTRLQSLLLQSRFDWSQQPQGNGRNNSVIISYGPCQFPTLGLIVRREW
jgi:DNA topoisomerase III